MGGEAALPAGARVRRAGRSPAWWRSGWIGELAHHGQHLWGGLRSGADFSPQPGFSPAAVTGTDGFRSASALITAIMVAPPAMSYFIFSMPSAGLMEMPPARYYRDSSLAALALFDSQPGAAADPGAGDDSLNLGYRFAPPGPILAMKPSDRTPSVPAYTVDGVIGSTARTRTLDVGSGSAILCQAPPPLVVLYTPPERA